MLEKETEARTTEVTTADGIIEIDVLVVMEALVLHLLDVGVGAIKAYLEKLRLGLGPFKLLLERSLLPIVAATLVHERPVFRPALHCWSPSVCVPRMPRTFQRKSASASARSVEFSVTRTWAFRLRHADVTVWCCHHVIIRPSV